MLEIRPDFSVAVQATVPLAHAYGATKLDSRPFVVAPADGLFLLVHNTPKLLFFLVAPSSLSDGSAWPIEVAPVDTVLDIKIIDHKVSNRESKHLIAVLYRRNVSFSLRYYEFTISDAKNNLKPSSAKVVKQFMNFADAPTCLVAVDNGVLVLSDVHIYFFPSLYTRQKISLTNSTDSSLYELDQNITKKIVESSPDLPACMFVASTKIDESRYLIISDTGESFLLYCMSKSTPSEVQVLDIRFIALGKSTIPSNVVHITKDVFFASSRLSQSILFSVQPKSPHVSVIQYFPSSPPVLDMEVLSAYPPNVVVCQGGYNNSEICNHSKNEVIYKSVAKRPISGDHLACFSTGSGIELTVMSNNDTKSVVLDKTYEFTPSSPETAIEGFIAAGTIHENRILLTSKGYFINNSFTSVDLLAGVVATNLSVCEFVFLTSNGKLFYCKNSKTHLIVELESPLDIVQVRVSKSMALVSSWKGLFSVHNMKTKKSVLLSKLDDDSQTIVQSEIIADSSKIYVFLLSSKPALTIFTFKGSDVEEMVELPIGSERSIIRKYSNEDRVVVSSKSLIYTFAMQGNSFSMVSQGEASTEVRDFQVLDERGSLAVLSSNLEVIKPVPIEFEKTIFTDSLIYRVLRIPRSNYLVSLVCTNKVQPSGIIKQWQLQLIDLLSMKIISRFEFQGKDEPVDLILVPSYNDKFVDLPNHSFLVLNKGKQLLKLFCVDHQKLKVQKLQSPSNYKSGHEPISIMALDLDNLVFLVTGDISFDIELVLDNGVISWAHQGNTNFSSLFVTKAVLINDNLITCDATHGVIERNQWKKGRILPLETIFNRSFTTDFDAFTIGEDHYLVIGDARGNLLIHDLATREVRYLVNLGSQINSTKTWQATTVRSQARTHQVVAVIACGDGGIYELSFLDQDTAVGAITKLEEYNLQHNSASEIGHRTLTKWEDWFGKNPESNTIYNTNVVNVWLQRYLGQKPKPKTLSAGDIAILKLFIYA